MKKLEEVERPYSKAIIQLLKRPIDKEERSLWESIISNQNDIQNYIQIIGLELVVREEEGFAFVRQLEGEQGETLGLAKRKPIGIGLSVVLVVLRQLLEDFDNNPSDYQSFDRIISHSEIKEEVSLFLQEGYDKVKFSKNIDRYIEEIKEWGFLKVVNSKEDTRYKIHRIIKQKITLDMLEEFKQKLSDYVGSI
ncbi:DUF4194 domain-containing protein [Capnocytophaga granulosa]|uniref:DUF4194 domain-containing protein n=1 Tax=Capnocytophaga granulosa TaxID=45242 RepID=UPI0028ED66F8|nr:DUF4194 domain-containing protein [Capnocytophaga granulosa]